MATILLPTADRTLRPFTITPPRGEVQGLGSFNRVVYAAAHVVADPLADRDPWLTPAIDWEATIRFRHHLWDVGLGVAEAMDTAQRGMGLGWEDAKRLIAECLSAARARGSALVACGAGTDHLQASKDVSIDDVIRAYEDQIEVIEGLGGRIILMASRALAAAAKGPDDYVRVCDRILRQVKEPVIIHWLGEMFDPALSGYWGSTGYDQAMETCLSIIRTHADKIDGIKISLLSKEKEIAMRRRLPADVRMYTGDDFNYAELIAGDEAGHSDALLGIFDAIAPAASGALHALARGDKTKFFEILDPTIPLSRHIFKAPTRFYKTGIVFLAYLNGHQDHFTMVGGQESARSLLYLAELFRLADQAGVLRDPDLAAGRMRQILVLNGILEGSPSPKRRPHSHISGHSRSSVRSSAATLRVREVAFFERHVALRLPFRFGVVTLREAPQAFVRARISVSDGREGVGQSAELLVPKWFDKNPDLTNEQNFDQLRKSLAVARDLYLDVNESLTPFGLHAQLQPFQYSACAERGLNGLIAGFGSSLLDRAILDALCRMHGVSVYDAVRQNLPGIDAATSIDLAGFDFERFLRTLSPGDQIDARHTVGLLDAITEAEVFNTNRIDDGLPESLEGAIKAYGHSYFKLKVSGDISSDIDRLSRIASVLDRSKQRYFVTLDGNEQYEDADAVMALLRGMADETRLNRLNGAILYIEQPIARSAALKRSIHKVAKMRPVAVDESDSDVSVFPIARALGYRGISSKSCKGFYRSILNRARAQLWNADDRHDAMFLTAEDLTTQAGIAVEQDLALATLIGCTHVERNGHHYVDGMTGATETERERFLRAHPGLYHRSQDGVRLSIREGKLDICSLSNPGLGGSPEPDWDGMRAVDYDA